MENPITHDPIFCADCPMRGDVQLPIETIYVEAVKFGRKKHWRSVGTWAVLGDADKNQSEPIRVPDDSAGEDNRGEAQVYNNLRSEISVCEGPDTAPGVLFKWRQHIIGCHALKGLSLDEALSDDDLWDEVDEAISGQLKMNGRLVHFKQAANDLDRELRDITSRNDEN